MFAVGLDVDTLVSKIVVTLFISIGLYAGKLHKFLIHSVFLFLKVLFGKIQINTNKQPAGNSESFDDLNLLIQSSDYISDHLVKHKKPKTDEDFGYYLAGLIEGSGNFDPQKFEIMFNLEDTFLAYFIKKQLGYGSVLKFKENKCVIYILTHPEGLKKIISLVNGKFLTNNKIDQLLTHKYDLRFNIKILPSCLRNNNLKLSFDLNTNYWLAGYSDAKASFVINLAKNKNMHTNINLEFNIKEKIESNDLLELIRKTFGGNLYLLDGSADKGESDSDKIYYYNSTNFKSAKLIIQYFDNYNLNSSKYIHYLKWRKIYRIIQRKEHLDDKGINKIKRIQKNLRD